MLKVGLTGGIACGKSYVLEQLVESGAYALDADRIAHSVMSPSGAAYDKLVNSFGPEILSSERTVDRKKLGKIVFSDPSALERLNRIVHPHVLAEEQRRILAFEAESAKTERSLLVVDAPLMIEVGSYTGYDVLVVVYCRAAVQLHRLMQRDHLSSADALTRIRSQMPVLRKARYADFVVDNSESKSQTRIQVKRILEELIPGHPRVPV